jgi:(p)ppGpp synthase/HD superfamily hydrolase
MTVLTVRFDDALSYASRIHREQRRKGTDIPYVAHLLAVASLTLQHGGTEDQAIAALLHDAAEDQGGEERLADIRSRYGEAVADIVDDCTDAMVEPKPPWRPRKEAYLASLEHKPETSLLVSLADKTHNATAIVQDLRVHGDALWSRFTGGKEGSIWYYGRLGEIFGRRMPGPLADELARQNTLMATLSQ